MKTYIYYKQYSVMLDSKLNDIVLKFVTYKFQTIFENIIMS